MRNPDLGDADLRKQRHKQKLLRAHRLLDQRTYHGVMNAFGKSAQAASSPQDVCDNTSTSCYLYADTINLELYSETGCSDVVDAISSFINDFVTFRTKTLPNLKTTPILLGSCLLKSQSLIQGPWVSSLNALVVVIDQLSLFTRQATCVQVSISCTSL